MLVQPIAFSPMRSRASSRIDPSLVESVVASGIKEADVIRDVKDQLPNWSAGLDFVREHGWRMVSDPQSAVWIYEIGGPDREAGRQRAMFSRRDGDMLLDTTDPKFSQRVVIDRNGNVQANSGKKPRPPA